MGERYWPLRHRPDDPLWDRLWDALGWLPQACREQTWGVLTFRVGRKLFAVAGGGMDGEPHTLTFKPDPDERPYLLADPRFRRASHFKLWLSLDLPPGADLAEAAELLTDSYIQVAPKALAAQVAARAPRPGPQSRSSRSSQASPPLGP